MANEETQDDGWAERSKKYAPNALPEFLTRKLWITYGMGKYNNGQIEVQDYKPTGTSGHESVILAQSEITFKIPKQQNMTQKAVEVLEEQKKEIMAEYHQQLKKVQDRIDNLLAIEYQPQEIA